eukprot:15493500-Heterocapsa_arctica.AAC.1
MIKSLYDAASWKLAMELRAGRTFDESSFDIIRDTHWWRDYIDAFRPAQSSHTGPGRGRDRSPSRRNARGQQ